MLKEVEELWNGFRSCQAAEYRNRLVLQYTPFLKRVVRKIYSTLPNCVDISDLENYAYIGLMDAIKKFDIKRNIKFETYAGFRIRGAVLDGLRKIDWMPRTMRAQQKKLENEENGYSLLSIDDPNFSESRIKDINEKANRSDEGRIVGSAEYIDIINNRMLVKKALLNLSKQEKRVVFLYYFKGSTFKEIGVLLEVTESRISQIHKKALGSLKKSIDNCKVVSC